MEQYNILLVEDDTEIRNGMEIFLRNQGYQVYKAADGIEGLDRIKEHNIHIAIVDIMMPHMDGITMLMKLRETHDFPVIVLSAKSEEMDKVMGLNVGADDYVAKPFTPLELLARIQSQLRRYQRYLKNIEDKEIKEHIFTIGGMELNEETVEVSVDDTLIKVTPMEFKILKLFIKNPGRVFSSEEIYERIWNEKAVNTDTIMVHIKNIRDKIEINPKDPKYIKVVWGIGYKMEKQ